MHHPEQVSTAYLIRNSSIEIDANRSVIWPLLVEFEKFNQTFERVDVLSGRRDEVGSVSLLVKQEGEWFMPPYLVKIVRIVPEKQIVWKMFPQEGDSFFAFVDFSLHDQGSSTLFTSDVYSEVKLPRMSEPDRVVLEEQMGANYDKLEGHIFPILKRLAETP